MATPRDQVAAAHRDGRFAEADAGYRRLLAASPFDPALRHDHAVLLLQHGRRDEAQPILEGLVREPQPFARCEFLLAMVYRDLGRSADALALVERYLVRAGDDPWALALAGALRTRHGDARGGEAALRQALRLEPTIPDALHDLGIALHRQKRWREACAAYRSALAQAPDDFELLRNLARCLESDRDLPGARDSYAQMHRRWPDRIDVLAALAGVQAQCCDFDAEAVSVARIEALLRREAPVPDDERIEAFAATYLPISHAARAAVMRRCNARIERDAGRDARLPAAAASAVATSRLRIGYLSPDFGQHAVGTLVRDLFAAHDRAVVDVFGYSLRRHEDEVALAIRAGFDTFRECEDVTTGALAAQIRADRIQVLIDLGGYTADARPELLVQRPAPLQLGYLGFIHDYGADWIDGVLLDAQVDVGEAPLGRRLHLAGCMLPASRRSPMPTGAARADFGLPEGVPLFASFNNSYKLDRELLDAWLSIARDCPDAAFAVYAPECAAANLVEAWISRGGARSALHLVPKLAPERHRARAACCDLFLDAFRYQAGATGIAAIEAGLPILCREGTMPLARLGVSLNRLLGLDELVCSGTGQYIERACEIARDPARARALRIQLEAGVERSALFEPRRVAAAIETCVLDAWHARCTAAGR
jgi:protein O-GlcNAc transferase